MANQIGKAITMQNKFACSFFLPTAAGKRTRANSDELDLTLGAEMLSTTIDGAGSYVPRTSRPAAWSAQGHSRLLGRGIVILARGEFKASRVGANA
jgi:hypothetical protein